MFEQLLPLDQQNSPLEQCLFLLQLARAGARREAQEEDQRGAHGLLLWRLLRDAALWTLPGRARPRCAPGS